MSTLVIVESPAKAHTIKKMLGSQYHVVASVGHVRDLPKSKLGVDIENDFEPKYINIRGKGPIIKELKEAAKKADHVLLATDPDREGEAISWHLAHILDLDQHEPIRVEFNEITKKAVENAIKQPRPLNQDVVDAQQGRRVLDRLVGYQIGPLLWKKIKGGLSAGRVQSVAVKLICEREEEIRAFVPEEYWTLDAHFKDEKYDFKASYYGEQIGSKEEKRNLNSEKETDALITSLKGKPYAVDSIEKKNRLRNPSPPFITSTLQQEASKRLGFSARKTMVLAQMLYEGIDLKTEGTTGLITYMRTDSTRIAAPALSATKTYIETNLGKQYTSGPKQYGKTKNAQDAHECIRPTDVHRTPEQIKADLTTDQYRLYELIWTRFVASQMKPATFESHVIRILNGSHVFRATGQKLVFDGFLRVYPNRKTTDEPTLPDCQPNDQLICKDLEKLQHFTQPPARYTESSLIKMMEELGIGRPSTYAPTINTIIDRNYVVLEQRSFEPTELGEIVNKMLVEYFPSIVDEEFTAEMEGRLDKIEDGETTWKQVIRDFYGPFESQLERADKEYEGVVIGDEVTDVICEKCGRNMVIKQGRYGKFLACPGYPECKNTQTILKSIGVTCPKCKEGELVERRGKKRGKKFYGCSRYPECDFSLWDRPTGETCPKCGKLMVEKKTKEGVKRLCSDPECGYKKSAAK